MNPPKKASLLFTAPEGWLQSREWIRESGFSQVLVLADTNTARYCLSRLQEKLDLQSDPFLVSAGEESKTLLTAELIWRWMAERGADRHMLLINLGGGMVTDLGGFVASVYMRGISFVHVPTSLLGQVDASIGGKTGVDFDHHKNRIGTFALPDGIILDPHFLETLPEHEWLSGFAEMLKHGLIRDESLWMALKNVADIHQMEPHLILQAAAIKQSVVDNDPLEKGGRKMLNFGHTIGHAIESHALQSGNTISHGEAIAAGMLLEGWISWKYCGMLDSDWLDLRDSMVHFYKPLDFQLFNSESCMPFILADKKNSGSSIRMVILKKPGIVEWDWEVSQEQIRDALNVYPSFF